MNNKGDLFFMNVVLLLEYRFIKLLYNIFQFFNKIFLKNKSNPPLYVMNSSYVAGLNLNHQL